MRKIIVLNNQLQDNNTTVISYVLWLLIPASLQKSTAIPSVVPDVTVAEATALQNGSVLERSGSITVTTGFIQSDVATILMRTYNAQQAIITNQNSAKNYTGTYWDGTSWFNLPA